MDIQSNRSWIWNLKRYITHRDLAHLNGMESRKLNTEQVFWLFKSDFQANLTACVVCYWLVFYFEGEVELEGNPPLQH